MQPLHKMSEHKLQEVLTLLDRLAGKSTNNGSSRLAVVTPGEVRLEPTLHLPRVVKPAHCWLHAALAALVAAHAGLVVVNIAAFFVLPFLAPWYVSVPLMTFLFSFMSTRQECQLTNLENRLRQRLGKRGINGFVGHYFVRPVRRWLRPPGPQARSA